MITWYTRLFPFHSFAKGHRHLPRLIVYTTIYSISSVVVSCSQHRTAVKGRRSASTLVDEVVKLVAGKHAATSLVHRSSSEHEMHRRLAILRPLKSLSSLSIARTFDFS